MVSQLPNGIVMIRPSGFGINPETAASNKFQHADNLDSSVISSMAREEFDRLQQVLEQNDIPVFVFEEEKGAGTPDAVFPNNWISFHSDGTVVIYPMESPVRRKERRMDILEHLENEGNFKVTRLIDLSCYERGDYFLESTGSLVFDYPNHTAYVCRSTRSSPKVMEHLCALLGLKAIWFDAVDKDGFPIYHTNVMMCLGERFAILCEESIPEGEEKELMLNQLKSTGHEIIPISLEQVYAFAGNMLEVKTASGQPYLLMSESARASLNEEQISRIEKHSAILSSAIPTIQKYGGGSIRCMLAGVMLPFNNPNN